ncbi:MAG: DUF389 domain-containing protein [bacterium]|nr:DUF389 domain-containing protein [bacterium]
MQDKTKTMTNSQRLAAKKFFRNLFDIRDDMLDYDELCEMMEENTIIHGSNMWILIMAIFIASIGLNVNSTAVIIGAMLISPLMSGILTMGYSLATSDLTMLRKAFMRFGTQVIISLITSTIYFLISPIDIPTSEMIARTSPTLWDVLIALFGGIAGAIGNTRKKKGNVVPGVAIATALMPPLCTTGYGIATLQPRFIFGAFYLFSINMLFIMLSAALVTRLLKVPVHEITDVQKRKKVKRLITCITVLTVIPSVLIGGFQVYQTVMEQNFADYLNKEFVFRDTQVVKSDIDIMDQEISVSLVGAQISSEVIAQLEQSMVQYNLEDYTLCVTQNSSVENDDTDKVTIALQEKTIQDLQSQVEEQQLQMEEMERAISSEIDCKKIAEDASSIFTKLSDCGCGIMSGQQGEYIFLTAKVEETLSQEEEQIIKNWLITESGLPKAELLIQLQ